MTNNVKILLILLFCFQLLVGSGFGLAHDEAYYWVFSNHLDWGYFDHPPAVALIIKVFSFLPHSELSTRIGFIILQFSSVLILLKLIPENRKLESIFLYFAFPLASMVGLFALPDMPLLFMTAVYFWCLREFLKEENLKNSLLLGFVIAILLNTKYHGILLIFFTILAMPSMLKKQKFYLTFFVSIILFLPHILWQYEHEFATLKYHFFERPKSSFSVLRVLEYLGTQILFAGLLIGPVVWWTVIKSKAASTFEKVLKFNALGIIIFFFISSFSKKIEANWTILTAIPLIILTLKSEIWTRRTVRILMLTSFIIILFARMALVIELPIKRSMEFHGWKTWSNHVFSQCNFPLLANNYQLASKLNFYLQKPIHALNYQSRKNQFDLWKMDPAYYQSEKVCYLTNSNQFGGKMLLSPEGKELYLVQDRSLKELLELKSGASLEKL